MVENIADMEARIKVLEQRFVETGYTMQKLVTSTTKMNSYLQPQAESFYGLATALCVDTIDPWKQNRVRFYSPLLHRPDTDLDSLPYAWPISAMGGFDDCGLNWVPPCGSMLCILFEAGERQSAYYLGTTWNRNRGPDGGHNFGFPIDASGAEYAAIHEKHRKGYLLGADDGSQVLPPWNTESYGGIDIDSQVDFDDQPNAGNSLTYANIYGFKTPQKHMLKMVDGDYKCSHKNKRVEILSGCGNWLLMKDDHLHEFDPQNEDKNCEIKPPPSAEEDIGEPPPPGPKKTSAFFKHKNELRPWKGVETPQNNKCELKQSGIQLLSISGHSFLMDDAVEEPIGRPDWERSMNSFDFGSTDKFLGKTSLTSATGHKIVISDKEDEAAKRGTENYIRMLSACGNRVELNDHTVGENIAGDKRGITLQSTSNHTLEMLDEENEQSSPVRQEGGSPIPKAKKAFVRIRSGYGLEFMMRDEDSQEKTVRQHIQIFSPQRDNKVRGPHIMRFQETPDGPGQVFVRAGGQWLCSTYDEHITIVGDKDVNASNKITMVSSNTLIQTEKFYFNIADLHIFKANRVILLMAGNDCEIPEIKDSTGKVVRERSCTPCLWPVLVATPKGVVMSDRVFASASAFAACASIFQFLPFHKCIPFKHC
jgi:hypothetical protein